jgi:hypothetical protein
MKRTWRTRQRFLPADDEWPKIRDDYVTLMRAGYSAEEASKVITTQWFKNHKPAKAKDSE